MKQLRIILLIMFLAGCSSNQPLSVTTVPDAQPVSSPVPTETILPATQTSTPAWQQTIGYSWDPAPQFFFGLR